jgi:acyl carrier protein
MSQDDVTARLLGFIRDKFLGGDPKNELDESTPLLEWGVLNSMNTALLLNFLRDDLGITVPPIQINGQNFKSVKSITALVQGLSVAAGE